jgi:hypothetical protein
VAGQANKVTSQSDKKFLFVEDEIWYNTSPDTRLVEKNFCAAKKYRKDEKI